MAVKYSNNRFLPDPSEETSEPTEEKKLQLTDTIRSALDSPSDGKKDLTL